MTIKVSTKPCPKCRTPTERDGKQTHMVTWQEYDEERVEEEELMQQTIHNLLQSIFLLRRWLHAHGLHTRRLRLRVVLGVPDRVDA